MSNSVAARKPAKVLTGLRAGWRSFATMMALGYRTGPALFVFLFIAIIVSSLCGVFVLYATKLLVDAAVSGTVAGVLAAAVGMAGARAAQLILGHQYVNVTRRVREKTQLLVDQRLMDLTGTLPGLEHEERPDYADELALLHRHRGSLAEVANTLVLNLRLVIRVGGGVALLAVVHPALALLPLLGIPPFLASKRAHELTQRAEQATVEVSRTVRHLFERGTATASGKELRIFGLADHLIDRHRRLTDQVVAASERAQWQGTALSAAGEVCFAAGYIAAVGLVLWRALNGQATAGDVVLAAAVAADTNGQVATAVQVGGRFLTAIRATRHYLWLVDHARDAHRTATSAEPVAMPERLAHGITLDGVSFTYPGTEQEILKNVSVHLPAGKVVALVGENGAGKTTLVKLLSRFYEPAAGRVLVDGMDLRLLNLEEWRARTSAAYQDFRQFEFAVRETVGIGQLPSIQDAVAVRGALVRAGADDLEPMLPAGLETQLGRTWDGGVDLSGGQWQRLALGRAFMRHWDAGCLPLLVVFDEPTAAIDASTEHALFERFAAAARAGTSAGTVTLIVSHRFSTVRMADVILVLENGTVIEQGSHEELVEQGGLYANLYELQARAYRT